MINYRELEKTLKLKELENLLKESKWMDADKLTAKLMYQIAKRERASWLSSEHIEDFPLEDLQSIDQIWVQHSNNKFGFSVQKDLWLECGGVISRYDYEVWKNFAARVGWYQPPQDDWRTYAEFINGTQNAQQALLASLPYSYMCIDHMLGGLRGALFLAIIQRIATLE